MVLAHSLHRLATTAQLFHGRAKEDGEGAEVVDAEYLGVVPGSVIARKAREEPGSGGVLVSDLGP
jgi:hypothetical protein